MVVRIPCELLGNFEVLLIISWPHLISEFFGALYSCCLGLGNISIYHQYQEIRPRNIGIANIFTS